MLVRRRARRQGLGAALMRAAGATARECGKTLLVLDTVTGGDAERLYERLGWKRVGVIPGYALWPPGGLCSTTVFLSQPRLFARAPQRAVGRFVATRLGHAAQKSGLPPRGAAHPGSYPALDGTLPGLSPVATRGS
jgi:predicted N-acetyltransferase YhbS